MVAGEDLAQLRERLGAGYFDRRFAAQSDRAAHRANSGRGGFHLENIPFFMEAVYLVLRGSGLYRRGQRNALALRVTERTATVPGLPPAFDGLRLLQISDLHVDGYPGFGEHLAAAVARCAFDLCVLTGDFRFHEEGRYRQVSVDMAPLAPALACRLGAYGILGNHDFVQMVPLLEELGVRMLVNEAAEVRKDGASLWLVGLDDPHFYGMHDFERAGRAVPADAARILLVHSPEVIREAQAAGYRVYLTGHTHGGQIRLPGGHAPYLNARCPRRFMAGPWRYGDVDGYTSLGAGASGVWVRFFCPPEVVVHTLRLP